MTPTSSKQAPARTEISVIYNGIRKTISYQDNESMQALLEQALNAFNIQANRHVMALFTLGNSEYGVTGSVKDSGINPGDELVLRQSTVRGG
jgi:hypothetical protein